MDNPDANLISDDFLVCFDIHDKNIKKAVETARNKTFDDSSKRSDTINNILIKKNKKDFR